MLTVATAVQVIVGRRIRLRIGVGAMSRGPLISRPVVIRIIAISNCHTGVIKHRQGWTAQRKRRSAGLAAIADSNLAIAGQSNGSAGASRRVHIGSIIKIHRAARHIHLVARIEIRAIMESENGRAHRQRRIHDDFPVITIYIKIDFIKNSRDKAITSILEVQCLVVHGNIPTTLKRTILTGLGAIDGQRHIRRNIDRTVRTCRRQCCRPVTIAGNRIGLSRNAHRIRKGHNQQQGPDRLGEGMVKFVHSVLYKMLLRIIPSKCHSYKSLYIKS